MSTKPCDTAVGLPPHILFTAEGTSYEFIRDLGVGPHGEQLALALPRRADGPGAQVVVKSLSLTAAPHALEQLRQECHLASRLEHPNLTRVHGLHEVAGSLHAVQEYVESRTLDELYTDALLCGIFCSERFVLYVAAELASALHAAHVLTDAQGQPLGIFHGDLHPDRIRLSTQGQVKLGGFGLSTSRQDPAPGSGAPPLRDAIAYASPEQLLQRPVDARSDQFSLGLLVLELLTGQHLYRLLDDVDLRLIGLDLTELPVDKLRLIDATIEELGRLHQLGLRYEGLAQLAQRASSFVPEDVERLAEVLPEPTRLILHKLLRQKPEERYGSAAELEQALRERLQVLGPYGATEAAEEMFLLQAEALGLASLLPLEDTDDEAGDEADDAADDESQAEDELTPRPT